MKERLIKALDTIMVKQHLKVLKEYEPNSSERVEEAIAEATAKLESGTVCIMAGVLRSDVKDMIKGMPTLVNGILTPDGEFSEERQIEHGERLNSFRKMLEDKHWIMVGGYLIITLSNEGLIGKQELELLELEESNGDTITELLENLASRHRDVSKRFNSLLTYHRVLFGYDM